MVAVRKNQPEKSANTWQEMWAHLTEGMNMQLRVASSKNLIIEATPTTQHSQKMYFVQLSSQGATEGRKDSIIFSEYERSSTPVGPSVSRDDVHEHKVR